MKKPLIGFVLVVVILTFFAEAVKADDTLLKVKGAIGVIPVRGNAEPFVVNVVRGVNPPGNIWVIQDLNATVKTNGAIKVDGRGLLRGGGNDIGTATDTSAFATLICEAIAPFTLSSTDPAGVPLDASGNFTIDDVLAPAPLLPCASPLLLIRSAGSGNWFAAGISEN
ncbi:MAG: hypothetical protein ACREQW_02235 [Candidatus Binatia bacterium]